MMERKYKEYSEYKFSGVEWVGNIPRGWEVKPLFVLADSNALKNEDGLKTNVLSLSYGSIIRRNVDKNFGLLPESFNTYQLVNTGDIILRLTDLQNDKRSLRVGHAKESGIITSAYLKLVSHKHKLNDNFFYHLLHSYDTTKVFYGMGGGLRQTMKFEDMRRLLIIVPPITEQTQIANFLDHETAKIDRLIEKQQQLIKLLKEKRQAVISHAVTKGLDPTAPMRDSGIEWLGDVPAHWEVTKAKFLFDFITSGSRGWAEHYSEEGSLFFRIANLTRDTIKPKLETIQFVSPPNASEGERAKIKTDDLLISITADLGSVCVANDEVKGGYVSQHVSLCRPNKKVISANWLGYLILSDYTKKQFESSGYGGTKIQLSLEDIRELWLIKPSDEEQLKISEYISNQMVKLAILIEHCNKQITLLKERRTTLISATVTGKIDVRDWQAPEETLSQKEDAA